MTNLKDYLASLVSSISHSRAMADIQSVEIAKMYASDELLKHFSVPRMKIGDVELTIPVSINELQKSSSQNDQPIDNTSFMSKVYKEIKNVFQVSSLKDDVHHLIKKKIFTNTDALEKDIKSGKDLSKSVEKFAKEVSSYSLGEIQKRGGSEVAERIKTNEEEKKRVYERLNERIHVLSKREVQSQENLRTQDVFVAVEADKLRERDPKSLLTIKMVIREESMTWETMEDDEGEKTSTLTPE
jgi:predicted Fe-S protein YdhL (DUF1289 family)